MEYFVDLHVHAELSMMQLKCLFYCCVLGWNLQGARKKAFTHLVWNGSPYTPLITISAHSIELPLGTAVFYVPYMYLTKFSEFPDTS